MTDLSDVKRQAIPEAVQEKTAPVSKTRLAQECAKLDAAYEQAFAEEWFEAEVDLWLPY